MNNIGINIEELRSLTETAIREGREALRRQQEAEREARRAKEEAEKHKAAGILSQIMERCHTAAKAGKSYAIIMSLRSYEDYQYESNNWQTLTPNRLIGAARIVYDSIMAMNADKSKPQFKVTLESWYDDNNSGFNIVLHW